MAQDQSEEIRQFLGPSDETEPIRFAFWMPHHSLHEVLGIPDVKQMLSQVFSVSGSRWCDLHCTLLSAASADGTVIRGYF